MTPTLVFDIETIPDIAGIRLLENLPAELSDNDVAEMAFHHRRAQTNGSDFMPLHLQRVVAISCVLRAGESWKVWSIGTPQDNEATLIQRFYDGIEKFTPTLVSWNGGGFDLPVLHYRGLVHGITAERYWDLGDGDYNDSRDFKWNNYISRYHSRHTDLMDLLAMYQPRASAPLDALAKLCGFPGKLGMDGSAVWGAYQAGKIEEIRNYCETDVVNTYLVYLRFQKMRGHMDGPAYEREVALVRGTLQDMTGTHWSEYLAAWPASPA
jgi:predicted PolB exonuclease-like 3'-5' exonuclease